jgi:hypothetical protein
MQYSPRTKEQAMADEKSQRSRFRYEDIPALAETFADSIGHWRFDGHTLRIEFTVSRFDESKESEPQSGRRYPVCRLVLSTPAAIDLINRCRQTAAALEKVGLAKNVETGSPPAKAN